MSAPDASDSAIDSAERVNAFVESYIAASFPESQRGFPENRTVAVQDLVSDLLLWCRVEELEPPNLVSAENRALEEW